MKILLQQARYHGPLPSHLRSKAPKGERADFLIEDGVLTKVGSGLKAPGALVIQSKDLHLSRGFTDLYADFGTPGYENRETLESGSLAALAGGFTRVLLQPDTRPVLQSGGEVTALRLQAQGLPVEVRIAAALTEGLSGEACSDMLDLKHHGAAAFSNANKAIPDAGTMLRLLQYGGMTGLPLMVVPCEPALGRGAQVHESMQSVQWGLTGWPVVAETMAIDRDLALLGYLKGPAHLHFSKISSAESVEKVRQALAQGLRLSCGVAAHHLASTQEDVEGFRTDFKVYPPLRSSTDRAALMEGILDGTIAVICSDHQPGDSESKDVEFPAAAFGQAGIQHAFLAALEAGSLLDARRRTRWVSRVVHALTEGPERILGIHAQVLDSMDKGQPNGWVVFDPGYSSGAAASKAAPRYSQGVAQAYHNTPFRGTLLAVVGPGRTMVASEL